MLSNTLKPTSMLRYLRLSLGMTSLLLCAICIMFWMRSYHWTSSASVCYATGGSGNFGDGPIPKFRLFELSANNGRLVIHREMDFFIAPGQELELTGMRIRPSRRVSGTQRVSHGTTWGFGVRKSLVGGVTFFIPFWFLTLLTAAAGTLLWMQRPYRFTLRGALVATTFVAVVLGMGVALSR